MNDVIPPSGCTEYVPIQLTDITPVRVFDVHGEYLDTEIDLDTPVRVLQLAIEDYFKVKPEVQLLLHNRRPINPDRTLRENGCLLLKGDPYVRLVFSIKRGPVLNLVCHLCSTHEVVPVACPESNTVWELKKLLCEEIAYRRRHTDGSKEGRKTATGSPSAQQVRLLWRYMELSDKATLHYYRIPTNSVLSVMLRRSNSITVEQHPHPIAVQPREAAQKATIVVNPRDFSANHQPKPVRLPPPLPPETSYSLYTNHSPHLEHGRLEQQELGVTPIPPAVIPAEVGARIQELEETVIRFHGYLQRALTLI
ncbi:unnamed protein product [Phytomonas sp. EM1]|nr:unnamed protein product [Phytomonas sp. EM1]|eukprot:CCW64485.1 unnamed protein product [Phytomonas sp. isolate EM1]